MVLKKCVQGKKSTVIRFLLACMIATLCVEFLLDFVIKGMTLTVTKTTASRHGEIMTVTKAENGTGQRSYGEYVIKPIKVNVINCKALFDGNRWEVIKAKRLNDTHFPDYSALPNQYLANRSSDCHQYVRESGYITDTLTENEATFPIAFGIVMYKDAAQVEKLLRAIYRPQNVYCIQLDSFIDEHLARAMHSVAKCFPNVFLSNAKLSIIWGSINVVRADLACMRLLIEKCKKWKYFINLTGQEFPLRTNGELVDILRTFNGASGVQGTHESKWAFRYKKAGKPPHGFNPVTGSMHVILGRPFVEFVLSDQRAKDYLDWASVVDIPDETFVQTLYFTPKLKIPGAYKYDELKNAVDSTITRFKHFQQATPCRGRIARGLCILGIDYLRDMAKSRTLFANKFHWDYEPAALRCMEELLYNRTRDEYLGKTTFNATAYSKLDFVINQIKPSKSFYSNILSYLYV